MDLVDYGRQFLGALKGRRADQVMASDDLKPLAHSSDIPFYIIVFR